MMGNREPMKRGRAKDAEGLAMELPEGKTCADCAHCKRCCAIYGHIPADEVCDWYPSRYLPVSPATTASQEADHA